MSIADIRPQSKKEQELLTELLRADDAVLQWLNGWYGRWPSLDFFMFAMTNAPMLKFGVFSAIFVWLWFAPGERQSKTREGVIVAAAAGLLGVVLARGLALALPFRDRPFVRADLDLHFNSGYDAGLRTWSAFPSDHAVMAFALACGIWSMSRRLGVFAFLYGLVAICVPRLYMGLHHPSDILAGAVTGAGTWWLVSRAHLGEVASKVLELEARRPQLFYVASFVFIVQLTSMFVGLRSLTAAAFKLLAQV